MGKTKTIKQQLIPNRVQVIFVSRTWICLKDPDDEFVLKRGVSCLVQMPLIVFVLRKAEDFKEVLQMTK